MTFQRDILIGNLRLVLRLDSQDVTTHSKLNDDKILNAVADKFMTMAAIELEKQLKPWEEPA